MANDTGDVIVETHDLEVIASRAASGRLGLELNASQAHEPEEVIFVRDALTNFLVDNGYE